jgi:hypothetical protein
VTPPWRGHVERRYVSGGDAVYDEALRRARDGAVVCVMPCMAEGQPATFTAWSYPRSPDEPMPEMALDESNDRRRAAFLIAYCIHTRRHLPEVRWSW